MGLLLEVESFTFHVRASRISLHSSIKDLRDLTQLGTALDGTAYCRLPFVLQHKRCPQSIIFICCLFNTSRLKSDIYIFEHKTNVSFVKQRNTSKLTSGCCLLCSTWANESINRNSPWPLCQFKTNTLLDMSSYGSSQMSGAGPISGQLPAPGWWWDHPRPTCAPGTCLPYGAGVCQPYADRDLLKCPGKSGYAFKRKFLIILLQHS